MEDSPRLIQPSLFPELESPLELEIAEPPALLPAESAPLLEEPGPEAQPFLFAPLTYHRTDLFRAIAKGQFAEAVRLRERIRVEYGTAAVPEDLDCLDPLATGRWNSPDLPALLESWREAMKKCLLAERKTEVSRGLFRRLLTEVPPEVIASTGDAWFPALVNALCTFEQRGAARSLIRDALLRGVDLAPESMEDEKARDLLAEDFPPRWLAVLGALRGTWPPLRPREEEIRRIGSAVTLPVPESDSERALAFWDCLCVATLGGSIQEDLLHPVRRRMKALQPEFHALHMRERPLSDRRRF